jgi:deoxyribodipyrimidine photo-lyase
VSPLIVWFRQDLRLTDHPALLAAIKTGLPILPVYIWAPEDEGTWAMGAASRFWLHQSLKSLQKDLQAAGCKLHIFQGEAVAILTDLVKKTGAKGVFWSKRYQLLAIQQEKKVEAALTKIGCKSQGFSGTLLFDPYQIKTKEGNIYKVFTSFWKTCLKEKAPAKPLPAPKKIIPFKGAIKSVELKQLALEPKIDWVRGIKAAWTPGEKGAKQALTSFLKSKLSHYSIERDFPAIEGGSKLSPHLHFGEISLRQVWHAVQNKGGKGADSFLRQLGWREFTSYLLIHFPFLADKPLRKEFEDFPWKKHPKFLHLWQKGMTGYPIVDAGMRQLWQTGWMHNRVRMIVGSFLVKDLMVPWQEGEKWFWDTLVDADLANNAFGWQWVAGCGADAAPFFRVFNPVLQGEKFDPEGEYIRKFVPELRHMPTEWIHKPWLAPKDLRRKLNYPEPIVDHETARKQALESFHSWIKNTKS